MRKFAWVGLLGLLFAAGMLTAMAPSPQEACCAKNCDRGSAEEKSWRERHADAEACCKSGSCGKK